MKKCALDIIRAIHSNKKKAEGVPKKAPANLVLNFAFLGNPGTGKTEVGKLFGRFLHESGARLGGPPDGAIEPGTIGEANSKEEVDAIKAYAARSSPPRAVVFFHHDMSRTPIPDATSAYIEPWMATWAGEYPEITFVKVDGVQNADITFKNFDGFPSVYFYEGDQICEVDPVMGKKKKDTPVAAPPCPMTATRTGAADAAQDVQDMQKAQAQRQAQADQQALQDARDLKKELKDEIAAKLEKMKGNSGGSVDAQTQPIFTQTSGQELLREGGEFFRTMIEDSINGVIFIDEAHEIDPRANGKPGREIRAQLLLASNDHRNELTFILAGYREDVEKKLLGTDPGFGRRFHSKYRLEFRDYNESQIKTIWIRIMEKTHRVADSTADGVEVLGWGMADDDIAEVVARRIAKGSGRYGVGNAGEVQSQFDIATQRAQLRESQTLTIKIEDVIGPEPTRELLPYLDAALCELEEKYVGLTNVKRDINQIVEHVRTNWMKQKSLQKTDDIKLNRW